MKSTLTIRLSGGSSAGNDCLSGLRDWLQQERLEGIRVERQRAPIREGEMGGDWLPVLSVVADVATLSQGLLMLVAAIRTWKKQRREAARVLLSLEGANLEVEVGEVEAPDERTKLEQIEAHLAEADR